MLALANAWHERCMADPVVSHPFSHPGQHPEHLRRLAAYWGEALGGPAVYSETMADETHVLRLHAGNGEHDELDRRAVACFDAALSDVGITKDPLRSLLHDYFSWSTQRMSRYPESADAVPVGVLLPHWSWDGLQTQ